MGALVKRLPKELEAARAAIGCTIECCGGDIRHYRMILDVPVAGGAVTILWSFPDAWPFKPPQLTLELDRCGDVPLLRERLRLACPELVCFHPNDGQEVRFPTLQEQWSPVVNVQDLARYIDTRLRSPSLIDLFPTLVETVPHVQSGVVIVDVGSGGDLPPLPSLDGEPELFLLFDPCWLLTLPRLSAVTSTDARDRTGANSSSSAQEPCTPPRDPVWFACRNAQYAAIAAPYCWQDETTRAALLTLLLELAEKGWRSVVLPTDGTIGGRGWFPLDVPGRLDCYSRGRDIAEGRQQEAAALAQELR